jgi:hypothetical protein
MDIHATLLVLMYLILVYFTSYFINIESHLASGLFVLALSIIATRSMRDFAPLLALICIGTIALACYEFWAIFFPVCIVFFLWKIIGQATLSPAIKSIQGIIVVLYIAGSIINIVGIFSSQYIANRQDILDALHRLLPIILGSCLFFGSVVICGCFGSTLVRFLNLDRRVTGCRRFPCLLRPEATFPLVLWITFTVSIFLYFGVFPIAQDAYWLRSLNLFLPVLFALSFLASPGKASYSKSAQTIALFCVFPMLILTMQASLFNTSRWLDFKKSLFTATQQQSGFVSIDEVKFNDDSFLWGWTSPALSILMQALQGKNVQSIFFDPNATWQP